MSSLTAMEKRSLESLLGMGSGYVLDFSNLTFGEFVQDVTGKDVYDPLYNCGSGSKANRLRGFWSREPDHVVAELIRGLLDIVRDGDVDATLLGKCTRIAHRLATSAPVQDIDAIEPNADERGFEVLAESVRHAIQQHKPEEGIDRLHTFVVKSALYPPWDRVGSQPPLHSLFGGYLKSLRSRGAIESDMAERILKSTISILEAFNDVRNNRSLAHDNDLLTYNESLLIFNNVASAIRFLSSVEQPKTVPAPSPINGAEALATDIPF